MTKNDKKLVLITTLGISLSGILLFIVDEFYPISTEYGLRTNPLLDEVKLAHNFFNFLFIFSFGKIFNGHILLGLKKIKKKHRLTGNTIFYCSLFLGFSGVCLLYTSSDDIRFYLSKSHLIIGLILFIAFNVHLFFSRSNK